MPEKEILRLSNFQQAELAQRVRANGVGVA